MTGIERDALCYEPGKNATAHYQLGPSSRFHQKKVLS
jgi:hypothetical protein